MNTNIKPGDFVRLTDPLDNGTIVRIENVDENGFADWVGGSQCSNMDMEKISIAKNGDSPIGNDIDGYYFTLSEIVREVEKRVNDKEWLKLKKTLKLYPESAVEYWKRRAEITEEQVKLAKHDFNVLLAAEEKIAAKYSKLSKFVKPLKDFEL